MNIPYGDDSFKIEAYFTHVIICEKGQSLNISMLYKDDILILLDELRLWVGKSYKNLFMWRKSLETIVYKKKSRFG